MRVLSLLLPLTSFAVTAGVQILIPRILQIHLSLPAYAAFIVVTSAAGYIGMADGGMWLPVLRELSALHARNALAQYVGELRRSIRIYSLATVGGCLVAVGAFMAARPTSGLNDHSGIDQGFLWVALATFAATGLRYWSSTFYVAILFSTGRYNLGQAILIFNQIVPALALSVALFLSHNFNVSMASYAAAMALQASTQGLSALRLFRRDFSNITPLAPPRRLREMLSDGLAIRLGDQIALFGLPHALSIMNLALIPAAVPARTLANGCRLMCQQFVNILELRVTRQSAERALHGSDDYSEFHLLSAALSGFHLLLVGGLDFATPRIFSLWLPHLASEIRAYLPGLMAEQVLLSAALPSSMLFVSKGKFRAWGLAKLIGAGTAILALVALVRDLPRPAFGIACAAATLPTFALAAWTELGGKLDFPPPTTETKLRYARAAVVVLAYLAYAQVPWLAPTLALLLGLSALVPAALRGRTYLFHRTA